MAHLTTEKQQQQQPRPALILLRVAVLAVSFVLLLSSYYGIKFMQSSINAENGLGTASLAVVYASVLFSSIVLANPIVDAIGPKHCLALAMLGYMSYIALNASPSFYTLIPASVVIGLCSAPLWASMAKYNMQLAALYSAASGKGLAASSAIIFGLFYAISNTSYVWGNLISYLTLRTDDHRAPNATTAVTGSEEVMCGSRFCPANVQHGSRIVKPSEEKLYIMIGCFLAFSTCAVLIVAFLVPAVDSSSEVEEAEAGKEKAATEDGAEARKSTQQGQEQPSSLASKLSHTARQMAKPRQLLMTPQLINVGLSQSFAQGEFTQAFVACSQGVAFVGFVMMCYGGSQILSSLLFGKLAEVTNKQVCVYTATIAQLALDLFLLFWTVESSSVAPLFLSAIVCGMVDAAWNSQLLALQGELFPHDQVAAFSTYKVWESLGYIVGFAYSTALCTRDKLLVMISLLVVSAACFSVHNWLRLRDSRRVGARAAGADGDSAASCEA